MDCQEIRGGPTGHRCILQRPAAAVGTAAAPLEPHPALFESEEYNALPRELPGDRLGEGSIIAPPGAQVGHQV